MKQTTTSSTAQSHVSRRWVAGICLGAFLCTAPYAFAKVSQKFNPKIMISDGKDGRPNAKWSQVIKDVKVSAVKVRLIKKSGGDDTYVNLRCGGGDTLDGGKRIYLKNNDKVIVKWNCGGLHTAGQPLVMNAYNGLVYAETVWIENDPIK